MPFAVEGLREVYAEFLSALPFWASNFINLFLIVLLIVIYSIFIWKFYRFIARKDLFKFNLKQYNTSAHPLFGKLFESIFFFLEYILVVPFIVFIWFGIFTLFLMFLTEGIALGTILIISATTITAIRMTAYYNEDLSKDLAKMLPFTLLGVAITKLSILNFDKILIQLTILPEFFSSILIYLAFIIIIEFILRILDLFIGTETPKEEIKEEEK